MKIMIQIKRLLIQIIRLDFNNFKKLIITVQIHRKIKTKAIMIQRICIHKMEIKKIAMTKYNLTNNCQDHYQRKQRHLLHVNEFKS